MKKPIKCVHYHTIESHPACFAQGNVRADIEDDSEWEKITGRPWWTYPENRIGYLDIETSSLRADFAIMLSWAIKEKGGDTAFDVVTKQEVVEQEQHADRRIVESLCEEMGRYKILVGFYSTRFDLPFIRTKAVRHGITMPAYGECFHFDLYYTLKSKFNLSRRSLDNACDYFGLRPKVNLSKDDWRNAAYGNEKSLSRMVDHNVADVESTEELHDTVIPFRKWIRNSV